MRNVRTDIPGVEAMGADSYDVTTHKIGCRVYALELTLYDDEVPKDIQVRVDLHEIFRMIRAAFTNQQELVAFVNKYFRKLDINTSDDYDSIIRSLHEQVGLVELVDMSAQYLNSIIVSNQNYLCNIQND
jgi:hypothetical protein